MKRVTILTHSHHTDRRNGVVFEEHVRPATILDPNAHPEGRVRIGVAEDVPADVVREFYLDHPNYLVEGYTDEELGREPVQEEEPEEAVEYPQEDVEDEEVPEEEELEDEAEEAPEAPEEPEEPEEPAEEANPLAGVDFRTDAAAELAAMESLTADDFKDITPTGKGNQFIVKDVRKAMEGRA